MERVPEGLVFRLYPTKEGYRRFNMSGMDLPSDADFRKNDKLHETLKSFYAFMLTSRGIYEARFGNRRAASASRAP